MSGETDSAEATASVGESAADPHTRHSPTQAEAARDVWSALRSTLAFLVGWAVLNTVLNLRYPGSEPTLWYLLPSLDVFVIYAYLVLIHWVGWRVPPGVRAAGVVWFLLVRLIRLGDGVQQHYFYQQFNLYTDLPRVADLARFATATLPWWRLALLFLGLALGIGLLSWLLYRIFAQAEAYLTKPRQVAVFLSISVLSFAGVLLVEHRPDNDVLFRWGFAASAVPRLRREAKFLMNVYGERGELAVATRKVEERLRQTPSNLEKLHGADVYLIFVESYGQTVFERPEFVARTGPVYSAFESELGARGFSMVSGLMNSPTYGGHSWLAHATLSTGMVTRNQFEFEFVIAKQPKTIGQYFRAAGYRTVLVEPGSTRVWPKGEFYGFQKKFHSFDFDYVGPAYAWATMPDQYVLDFVRRKELSQGKGPRFVEYALVSSHAPWSDQPEFVEDWSRLGNGAIFNQIETVRYPIEWPKFDHAEGAYIRSIVYDFEVLKSYISKFVDDDALIIILGDHQPVAEVNGHSDSRGVPIHIVSRNRALLEPFSARGFTAGVRPKLGRPKEGLEQFLIHLLADFSSAPSEKH